MVNTELENAVFTIFALDLTVVCTFFASNLHKVNFAVNHIFRAGDLGKVTNY